MFEVRHFHSVCLHYYGLLTLKLDYKLPLSSSQTYSAIRLKKCRLKVNKSLYVFPFKTCNDNSIIEGKIYVLHKMRKNNTQQNIERSILKNRTHQNIELHSP